MDHWRVRAAYGVGAARLLVPQPAGMAQPTAAVALRDLMAEARDRGARGGVRMALGGLVGVACFAFMALALVAALERDAVDRSDLIVVRLEPALEPLPEMDVVAPPPEPQKSLEVAEALIPVVAEAVRAPAFIEPEPEPAPRRPVTVAAVAPVEAEPVPSLPTVAPERAPKPAPQRRAPRKVHVEPVAPVVVAEPEAAVSRVAARPAPAAQPRTRRPVRIDVPAMPASFEPAEPASARAPARTAAASVNAAPSKPSGRIPPRIAPVVAISASGLEAAASSEPPTRVSSSRAVVAPSRPNARQRRAPLPTGLEPVPASAAPQQFSASRQATRRAAVPIASTGQSASASSVLVEDRLQGVPLGSLGACLSDREEDVLKLDVVGALAGRTQCASAAGRYRFVETKNLNSFLMWIERAPTRGHADRCIELQLALECLRSRG